MDASKRFEEAELFVNPPDLSVPNYYEEISRPIDLMSMRARAVKNGYFAVTEFYADLDLILSNCRLVFRLSVSFLVFCRFTEVPTVQQ